MAVRLLRGDHFVPYWPPGLPLFLVPFLAALHGATSGIALRAAMLLWWALGCWGLWRLACDLNVENRAWMLLLVFGLSPAALQLSIEPLTQLPVAALLILSLSAALRLARTGRWTEALLLGLAAGYMGLVRPSGLLIAALLPLAPAWRRRSALTAALPLGVVASVAAAWLWRSFVICGHFVFNSSNSENVWDGNNPWTPLYRTWYFGSHAKQGSAELSRLPGAQAVIMRGEALPSLVQPLYFRHLAMQYVLHHPLLFLLRTFNRVCCFFSFDTFTSLAVRPYHPRLFLLLLLVEAIAFVAVLLPSAWWIAGTGRAFWRRKDVLLVLGSALLYALPYWASMSHPTYHFPVVVPIGLCGLAAYGPAGSSHRARQFIAAAVVILLQVEWVAIMATVAKV